MDTKTKSRLGKNELDDKALAQMLATTVEMLSTLGLCRLAVVKKDGEISGYRIVLPASTWNEDLTLK